MSMLSGLVDCASVACPNILTKTIERLAMARVGDIVEVVCATPEDASELQKECRKLGQMVVSIELDRAGNYRLEIEKV